MSELRSAPLVTGIGSLPGTDMAEACRISLGELEELPFLPELPARGPGADMIGRSAGMLVDIHVDLQPAGWRLVAAPGAERRRAADLLTRDIDTLVDAAQGELAALKVQVVGPWTLAAGIELTRGGPVLGDHGAVNDLAQSLAEGVSRHLADLRRLLPGVRLTCQLDEPALPAVLAGQIPTASGFRTLRSVDIQRAIAVLADVVSVAGEDVWVHCCASDVPVGMLITAGADVISVDVSALSNPTRLIEDVLSEGRRLALGIIPSVADTSATPESTMRTLVGLLDAVGVETQQRRELALTPACGLAGASQAYAVGALRHLVRVARIVGEEPGGDDA